MNQKAEEKITASKPDESRNDGGGTTSPEGILMLTVAGILDGIGFILFLLSFIGVDDYGILDIFGAIIIGSWLLITRGIAGAKKVLPKFLLAFGVEAIPFLGNASPSWIIFVYKVLK